MPALKNRKYVLLSSLIAVLSLASFTYRAMSADQTSAQQSIMAAETSLIECYKLADDTAEAGANVTSLLAKLNEAGSLLSRSKIALGRGDYDAAVSLADSSQMMLDGFASEANTMKTAAAQARSMDFVMNVVASAIGSVAVILCGIVVWKLLKKHLGAKEATDEA